MSARERVSKATRQRIRERFAMPSERLALKSEAQRA